MGSRPFDPLISVRDVQRLTTLSRATIYRFIRAGRFPEPVKLSPRGRVAWRSSDVAAWNDSPLDWGRDAWADE
jgi:prophage regulatory protein